MSGNEGAATDTEPWESLGDPKVGAVGWICGSVLSMQVDVWSDTKLSTLLMHVLTLVRSCDTLPFTSLR